MDGITIRADSASFTDGAPGPRRLAAAAFAWIDTGDPVPAGMDTVVERERVRIDADGSAWITGLRRADCMCGPRAKTSRPVRCSSRQAAACARPGDVVDSNSVLLASRAGQAGALPFIRDVQLDDPDAIAAEVRQADRTADLVLVIAGSSVGRGDHTAAVLSSGPGRSARRRRNQVALGTRQGG